MNTPGIEVGDVDRLGTTGAGGVLRLLLLDDLHGVIDGEDADQRSSVSSTGSATRFASWISRAATSWSS
jgi:hypothetical protein